MHYFVDLLKHNEVMKSIPFFMLDASRHANVFPVRLLGWVRKMRSSSVGTNTGCSKLYGSASRYNYSRNQTRLHSFLINLLRYLALFVPGMSVV